MAYILGLYDLEIKLKVLDFGPEAIAETRVFETKKKESSERRESEKR